MGKLIIEFGHQKLYAYPDSTVEEDLLRMIRHSKPEDGDDHIIDTSCENMIYAARCLRKENRLNGMELVIRMDGVDYPTNADGRYTNGYPNIDYTSLWLERLL